MKKFILYFLAFVAPSLAMSQNSTSAVTPEIKQALAPTGVLRAAINLGNPILANRKSPDVLPHGISIDMAQALADKLGVKLEMNVILTAGDSVKLVTEGKADIGFFAVDPERAKGIVFTKPYVLIEGAYAVRQEYHLTANEQVDAANNRIMVGNASAYDLYLSRTVKHATLVRAPSSPTVVDEMVKQGTEVAAGVKQQLEMDIKRHTGLRLLPGRFMVIEQAMGTTSNKSEAVIAFLRSYVEEQKKSGFVQNAMKRHGIEGAVVAPQ